ncbi:Hypothetical predicted protein [Podarcis lilfordi]|uniref:Sushi domain-containing protein n=1 Tax=Podarcis lilfordi TaxID=74358 RepID=A0AA35KFX3_9SAUR|nr:Hypothetical predicted protein [Podarcis lilfordi]
MELDKVKDLSKDSHQTYLLKSPNWSEVLTTAWNTDMNRLSYVVLLLLWRCCIFQQFAVFPGQVPYEHLVDPLTDSESPINCGPPPNVDNAMTLASSRREFVRGSAVFYQCYRMYEMEGTPRARCLHGQWVGVPRCLQTCRADDADMERNNIKLRISKGSIITTFYETMCNWAMGISKMYLNHLMRPQRPGKHQSINIMKMMMKKQWCLGKCGIITLLKMERAGMFSK